MPAAAKASAYAMVPPAVTSRPSARSTRANATAGRAASSGVGASVSSGTGPRRHDRLEVGPDPLLVLAVLEDRPQRQVDRGLVDRAAPERRQRVRPVDRLGHARRLVERHVP